MSTASEAAGKMRWRFSVGIFPASLTQQVMPQEELTQLPG